MFRDKTSAKEAPPVGVVEEEPLLVYEDIAKKTDTRESMGRSAILPDLLYKGRDGMLMKSS
jgi:hypothetical protein